MASPMLGLRPATSSVEFNSRPYRTGSRASSQASRSSARSSKSQQFQTSDPNLSSIEVEALLRERVKTNFGQIRQAFQNYDSNGTQSVTKGEFRRVLESFCLPLTTEQFQGVVNKVTQNPNATLQYQDFLEKFYGKEMRPNSHGKWPSMKVNATGQGGREANTDMVEKMLRDKIQSNMKTVAKALRLYDYNRDFHIQKHELRKVLENYCFKMTDVQYDKLYQRYDFHHRGMINYKDFLHRLGVNVENTLHHNPQENVPASMTWQGTQPPSQKKGNKYIKKPDDDMLTGLNFDQIELLFRRKMRENYASIKRMFLAMDRHLDGFIGLVELKNVLNQFTVPLTDQLFQQLMDRCGLKASGKISWEYFLEKFQDAQSHGNGQTIPIKPAHKYFPNQGTQVKTTMTEIVRLLDNHVKNAYGSFKKAFLEIDKNRNGKVSRKALRECIDKFGVRLTDGQFKELMNIVDPTHSNEISYHRFLDLFEPKEDPVEGHKWLKSVHRFNDVQKPAVLAWETIEDVLRARIEDSWLEFSRAIVNCDTKSTGRISPKRLREVIEKFSIPLSDEHFQFMCEEVADDTGDGKVAYLPFLQRLDVTIKPGDIEGLSHQITQSSDHTELRRKAGQNMRQIELEENCHNRTREMTADEVIMRLKDRMNMHKTEFRNSFNQYDYQRKGKISRKDFRAILDDLGMYMNDEQFKELCTMLKFTNGVMGYKDFVENFEDPRHGGPATDLIKANNHRVNKIRGDDFLMNALEVESKLRSKLRENFEDLRGAFYKFDDTHKGRLNRANFRRMLDAFMCFTSDEEFGKLCDMLGLDKNTKIGYKEFLEKFEVRDTEDGHKWLNSDHKFNETQPMPLLSAEECHAVLVKKGHQQFKDLAKMFRTVDIKGQGTIKRNDLREILYKFMLPISKDEFAKLWARYDWEQKGYISHQDFLERLSGGEFAPSDLGGTSQHIIANSYANLEQHHRTQQAKHEEITLNQAYTSVALTVEQVLQQLKDRIREQYRDFAEAFKKYDKRQKGYLTATDVQRILVDFNYFLDDDQFYDLLERIKLNSKASKLYYEDFVRVFEEGRKEAYEPKPANAGFVGETARDKYTRLAPEKAEEKLRGMVEQQLDVLQSAFQSFDPEYKGRIRASEFRRVIDNFCFPLSEKQFKHLLSKLTVHADNQVDYTAFVAEFKEPDSNFKRWLDSSEQAFDEDGTRLMNMDQVQELLREKVTQNFHGLAKAFGEIDYARIGVVSKEDFKTVLNKYTIRLSDDQVENLWNLQKVNDFGNLDYHEFLRKYCIEPRKPATPLVTSRPGTMMSGRISMLSRSCTSLSGGGRPFTPLVNAEGAEKSLQRRINRNWRDIQKQCRALDPQNTGVITQQQFRDILARCGSELNESDVMTLLLKYDLKNNDTFSYQDFLRHFVLSSQREPTPMLQREKTMPSRIGATNERAGVHSARSRLRACVNTHWKEMRREFRNADPSGAGTCYVDDFRDVMRRFNVNLTEDEFFSMTSQFDKSGTGNLDYGAFIKTNLQGA